MRVIGLKQFQYSIEIEGLEQFLAQELTLPDVTVDEVEHGEGNIVVRTPGMMKFGDLTVSKLVASTVSDTWASDLIRQINNPDTNTGQPVTTIFKTVVIRLKDIAGNVKKTYELFDCWIKQKTGISLSSTTSDNIIEEAIFVTNGWREF